MVHRPSARQVDDAPRPRPTTSAGHGHRSPRLATDHSTVASLTWLGSAALAFADAHVRDEEYAAGYLETDNLEVLSDDVFEWTF